MDDTKTPKVSMTDRQTEKDANNNKWNKKNKNKIRKRERERER